MNQPKRTLTLYPENYAICRLHPDESIPAWAIQSDASFFSITRSQDELSIICPRLNVPENVPEGLVVDGGWRCLKLNGPFDLDEPGVLASVCTPLARAGLSVFAVATYDTDHLLVQKLDEAIAALENASYQVINN